MKNDLLAPAVFVLLPRYCDATSVTIESIKKHYPEATWVAISSSAEESRSFCRCWSASRDESLLILRSDLKTQVDLAVSAMLTMIEKKSVCALGVILGDGPDATGFHEQSRRSWNDSFAKVLSKHIRDLQIVEYSSSWRYSPPRVR